VKGREEKKGREGEERVGIGEGEKEGKDIPPLVEA